MIKTTINLVSATALTLMAFGSAQADEMSINAASCFPIGSPPSKSFEAVVNTLNERGEGVLKVKLVGGAPAIGSPFTLTQKMAAGAYDMVGCTEAYFGNVLPEAPVLRFAEHSYAELRKSGGMAYLQELFGAKGIHYVGRHADNGPFHLWLSKPIDKPDLTGLHLRVSPVYTAFFTSLGATVQQSNIGQIYTYMENGTVQGFGWPIAGWVPTWAKVTKYYVEPGFYHSTLHTLVNLRKWNSLGQAQKDLIESVVAEFEVKSEPDAPEMQAAIKKAEAFLAENNIQPIRMEGADQEKWVKSAIDAGWQEVIERSPEHGPKLRGFFAK